MLGEQYNQLVHKMYQGVTADEGWHGLLQDLESFLDAAQVSLLVHYHPTHTTVSAENSQSNSDSIRIYERDYAATDPGLALVAAKPKGQWYIDQRDLGLATIARHEFYQEFMRSYGMGNLMTLPLINDGVVLAGLSVQSRAGAKDFGVDQEKRMAPLVPHLLLACDLRLRFQDLARRARTGQHLLDQIDLPVMLVNSQARILFANRAAEDWARKRAARAGAKTGSDASRIAQLAKEACRGSITTAVAELAACPRGGPRCVMALPLPQDHPLAKLYFEPVAMLVALGGAGYSSSWQEVVRQLYKLTPAELRLLEALLRIDTLYEAAEELGIAKETARVQIKSVFQKTGCRNQPSLSRLVSRFARLY